MSDIFNKKQSYLWGAALISASGFVSKILGAVYRIPLTNVLGGQGMGIYQMVFPLYCILLTVSASGIPSGIARLVSTGVIGSEKTAFRLFSFIGILGSVFMFVAANPLAALQGERAVTLCCKMLSPAVFFVSFTSVVRGYFQGKMNMLPTAVTELSEQSIKIVFGCMLAYINRNNLDLAVASTLAAVTISEIITALISFIFYTRNRPPEPLYRINNVTEKTILAYTVPITLTAIALPVSQLAESIVAVNIMRAAGLDGTSLYGIFSGCAVTFVNLPVSVTYGLAAASVPLISPAAANGDYKAVKHRVLYCLLFTLAIALPAAAALYIFTPFVSEIVFRSLSGSEINLLVKLVRIMSVSAVTLSLVQTSSSCLNALGTPFRATATQWITSMFRVILSAVLLKFTSLSVVSLAIAADCAYLLALFLNIWYIIFGNIRCGGTYEHNAYWVRIKRR